MRALSYAAAVALGLYGAAYSKKYYDNSGDNELIYFKPSEFGVWFPLMDQDLLTRLDIFRAALGSPVIVSSAVGGIGRETASGLDGFSSLHNVIKWGAVRAVDVMLPQATLQQGYQAARSAGFTGIGVYPDWTPYHGMHLDNRPDRPVNNPALWSGLKTAQGQIYKGINEVIVT